MPAKVTDRAGDFRTIDCWAGGVGWLAHPEETMQRASHALATDGGVWVVDPVDAAGVDDLLADLGEVAGVVVLSNYHGRDASVVAERHGVPVSIPEGMAATPSVDAPVERVAGRLPDTDYELLEVATRPGWYEYALHDGETLVVSESLGTAEYVTVGGERLGVALLVRLVPPRETLGGLAPERVLVGHGTGILDRAPAALADALANSRRRLPRALVENGPRQLRTAIAALGT